MATRKAFPSNRIPLHAMNQHPRSGRRRRSEVRSGRQWLINIYDVCIFFNSPISRLSDGFGIREHALWQQPLSTKIPHVGKLPFACRGAISAGAEEFRKFPSPRFSSPIRIFTSFVATSNGFVALYRWLRPQFAHGVRGCLHHYLTILTF